MPLLSPEIIIEDQLDQCPLNLDEPNLVWTVEGWIHGFKTLDYDTYYVWTTKHELEVFLTKFGHLILGDADPKSMHFNEAMVIALEEDRELLVLDGCGRVVA